MKMNRLALTVMIWLGVVAAHGQVTKVPKFGEGEEHLYVFEPDVLRLEDVRVGKLESWVSTEHGFDLTIRHSPVQRERIEILARAEQLEEAELTRIWFTQRWKLKLVNDRGEEVLRTDMGEWLGEAFEWKHTGLDRRKAAQITEPGINRVFWFRLGEVFEIKKPGKYQLIAEGVVVKDTERKYWTPVREQLPPLKGCIEVDEELLKEIEKRREAKKNAKQ